jgi:Fuc2NAc and GlcNAc transferase
MIVLLLLTLVILVSLTLTAALRRYALSRSLMDIPNTRSSHTIPTPRGGGLAVVFSFLLALPVLAEFGGLQWSVAWALLGAGAGIALLGFLDDHSHIAARWRLLGHFVAAAWLLFWLGGLPPVTLLSWTLNLGWAGHILAAVFLVWMLNLFNFMDGIDGVASIQAITTCLSGALLYWVLGEPSYTTVPMLLAAAVAGFLYWNFPPARIFMGDAGSGFLGIMLGGLTIQAAIVEPELLWAWLILMGVFVVDATFTLLRRLLRGDKVYEAHRSHAYQAASRRFGAHRPVSLGVLVINLLWLLPVALLVALGVLAGPEGLLLAYIPLLLLALYFRAGKLEHHS